MSNCSYDVMLYTDGGCSGNPGVGAWAFVACQVENSEPMVSSSGGEVETTNNRMELFAAIAALQWLLCNAPPELSSAVLYTDSQYLKRGMSEWLDRWLRRGWRLTSGNAVQNKDLWQQLLQNKNECEVKNIRLQWEWVKGHDGNAYNEMCHDLVTGEIAQLKS